MTISFRKYNSMFCGLWRTNHYISPDMKEKLRIYRYEGGDYGLSYIYFYNPFAQWLVEFLPRNLAPNLITMAGFMFTVCPFLYLFTAYGANFDTPIGGTFSYVNGVCYFIYRMLDELDGK